MTITGRTPTRLCVNCAGGYNIRVTQRWLTIAIPACPNPQCEEQGEPMEIG